VVASTTSVVAMQSRHPMPMRAAPAVTLSGTLSVQCGAAGSFNGTAVASNASTADALEVNLTTATSTATAGQAAVLLAGSTGSLLVSAEL
jgi:hypothetical protein